MHVVGPSGQRWKRYCTKPYQTKQNQNQHLVTKPQKLPMRYYRKTLLQQCQEEITATDDQDHKGKPRGDIISKVSLSQIDVLTLGLKRILSNKSEPLLLQLSLQRKELCHETKIRLHLSRKSVYNRVHRGDINFGILIDPLNFLPPMDPKRPYLTEMHSYFHNVKTWRLSRSALKA